jgi:hypothetical protein
MTNARTSNLPPRTLIDEAGRHGVALTPCPEGFVGDIHAALPGWRVLFMWNPISATWTLAPLRPGVSTSEAAAAEWRSDRAIIEAVGEVATALDFIEIRARVAAGVRR